MVSERTAATPSADDNSVYHHKGNRSPRYMYLYHLKGHNEETKLYGFKLSSSSPDMQIEVQKAVSEIPNKEPIGNEYDAIWTTLSYVVFVLDHPTEKLEKCNAVEFNYNETEPNHSFYNGNDLADFGQCSAMYCINFRRNRRGRPLDIGEAELFKWTINHKRLMAHNGTGTNLGP
jgi:hypothetical protein